MLKRKQTLTYKQIEALDPIEKFEKYGKIPSKMIIHILLVIFTACQAVLIVSEANKYSRSQERFFYNMFIDSSDKRSIDFPREIYLFSTNEIKEHLNRSVTNFYNLKSKSLEIVTYDNPDPHILLEFNYIDNSRINRLIKEDKIENSHYKLFNRTRDPITSDSSSNETIKKKFDYIVTNSTLGPFDYPDDDVKMFLNDVVYFNLNYTLKTYVPYYYNNNYDCNFWSIIQTYSFASRAHFIVRLSIFRLACADVTNGHSFIDLFINKLLWIHLIVLMLAIMSLYLTWGYIQWISSLYMKVRSKHKQKKREGDEEFNETNSDDNIYYNPLLDDNLRKQEEEDSEKVINAENENLMGGYRQHDNVSHYKFKAGEREKNSSPAPMFNYWSVICLVGNIIQIFGSAISIFDTNNILQSTEILVGFGCMLAFFNIGRYVEYAQNYSTIYVTIQNALPNVGRYLIGVAPIFLGFIFFGISIFWRSERFTNSSSTMIILFSLAQGDSVLDTFKDLSGFYFFMGQLYLYLFCIIFIVVVLNIFIAIIEEAYIVSKMKNKTHWVFDYIKKDTKQTMQFKPPIQEILKPKKAPENEFPHSYRNIQSLRRKSTSEINKFNRSYKLDSYKSIDEEKQLELQRNLENQFYLIEQEMKELLQLSLEIKLSKDQLLIDEIRVIVIEKINSSILTKTQDIRVLLSRQNL